MQRMTDAGIVASVMSTNSGFLLVLALIIPLVGALLSFVCGGRQVERIALGVMPLRLAITLAVASASRAFCSSSISAVGGLDLAQDRRALGQTGACGAAPAQT
jgi:hypothetical protein